jgi:hypothetical protein
VKRLTKGVLNVVIAAYLGVIYFSGVPETNTLNSRLKEKAMIAAFVVGIWPSWSMFAPNPVKFDTKSFVELRYRDGQVREYDVEPELTGPLGTFRKARWMKYSQDNLRNPNLRVLLAPAIRHFAQKYRLPGNPVVTVRIKRKWEEVHPFSHERLHSIYRTPRYQKHETLITQQVED